MGGGGGIEGEGDGIRGYWRGTVLGGGGGGVLEGGRYLGDGIGRGTVLGTKGGGGGV